MCNDSDDLTTTEAGVAQSPGQSSGPAQPIDTRELFGPRREITIEHEGVQYRLRITRRNKLILQK
jgi:hemin uptake protein HemP